MKLRTNNYSLFLSWMYRIYPSTTFTSQFKKKVQSDFLESSFLSGDTTPNQMRWMPTKIPSASTKKIDFVQGLITTTGAGDASLKTGLATHMYCANTSMANKAFFNDDGEMLIGKKEH